MRKATCGGPLGQCGCPEDKEILGQCPYCGGHLGLCGNDCPGPDAGQAEAVGGLVRQLDALRAPLPCGHPAACADISGCGYCAVRSERDELRTALVKFCHAARGSDADFAAALRAAEALLGRMT